MNSTPTSNRYTLISEKSSGYESEKYDSLYHKVHKPIFPPPPLGSKTNSCEFSNPCTPLPKKVNTPTFSTNLRCGIFPRWDTLSSAQKHGSFPTIPLFSKITNASTPLESPKPRTSVPMSTGFLSKYEQKHSAFKDIQGFSSVPPHTPCKKSRHFRIMEPSTPPSPSVAYFHGSLKRSKLDDEMENMDMSEEELELPFLHSNASLDQTSLFDTPTKIRFSSSPLGTSWKDDGDLGSVLSSTTMNSAHLLSAGTVDEFTDDSSDWVERLHEQFAFVYPEHEGEFSKVYRATNSNSQKPDETEVSVVKVTCRRFTSQKDKMRQLREATILQSLYGNEHIIAIRDFWDWHGHLFIETEYCQNGNFATFLEELSIVQPLDSFRLWKVSFQLLMALHAVHDNGFLHLDVKPANIFITRSGDLKLGDFGMATPVPVPAGTDVEGDRVYIAPEVLTNHEYSGAADIFSLGLVLLEAATNVVLPQNGPKWQQLRSADFSQIPWLPVEPPLPSLQRQQHVLREMIYEMLSPDVASRPKASDLLQRPEFDWVKRKAQLGAIVFEPVTSWLD
ncbi:WEE protein kinase Mik1 [Schizosaccharomyces japonicus yFS275]|uniref:WEE protein kinase Mik1 n=1 Tax=Schizosaccharomyces japonicus (strain yFS275 / FY16936) TaxID=402676 RepID=B6K585_SCHJY|nr:WEE protein kinase Mik1 [Schizosaccharomyces japonicus yFS275]EEB08689.1 WEE protein kinase Mik1 [Schizosaccharomyces japonicus yFS275]